MPLAVGDRLGPYEILAPLGAGGMGEVYRARDPRMGREVAIKISAERFSDRFSREVHAVAALNHPNICHLYDVGPDYLVMELVEGPTLAERIAHGAVPLEEALKIAHQIADALEAAHDKGIVHRDLKPANIKIRPDGTVKVLDFGLAKMAEPAEPGARMENSPTLTLDAATRMGVILGTAAYMSPEQARGKIVDKRADIWAFGAVLCEMVTGKRLFQGEDLTDTLASVVKVEPDVSDAPPQLRRLLKKCLEKDPKKRLRDIGDVWELLESEQAGVAVAPARSAYARLLPWIAAGVSLLAFATLAFVHFREPPPEAAVVNTTLLPPDDHSFNFSKMALPAISPDGKRIVFGAVSKDGTSQLWLRLLDSPTAQPLPGTEGGVSPFWSPDSRYVGFGSADNKLKKIDTLGGPPVTLTDLASPLRGASWNPGGVILCGLNTSTPVWRVSAEGGKASPATNLDLKKDPNGDRFPWFLPDGRHFLYVAPHGQESTVYAGSLDDPGKPGKMVATATSNVMYSEGRLLFLRENTLMAQPFDVSSLETTGEAVPLAEAVPYYLQPSRAGAFSVSGNGLLVYQSRGAQAPLPSLVWVDRSGKELGTLGEPAAFIGQGHLSPDEKSFAVAIREGNNVEDNLDVWIYDVARGLKTRFTFEAAVDSNPVWSPDGSAIVWRSGRNATTNLFRKPSNGSGTAQLLFADSEDKVPSGWSPDGKLVLYSVRSGGNNWDIWVLPVAPVPGDAAPKPYPLVQTPFNEQQAQFSPDGKWVAYMSNQSGQPEVYVIPFNGPSSAAGGIRQISNGGGAVPEWRRDGKEIFYVVPPPSGELMAAAVSVRNGTLEVGTVQKLFVPQSSYDVSADGQKFLVVRSPATVNSAASPPLTLVQNWTALLKK